MKLLKRLINRTVKIDNKGTTMIEMVVTFALLAIFMVSAASVMSLIVNQYYEVKAQTYAKYVSDILMDKMASSIEGSKYDSEDSSYNVLINDSETVKNGESITFYDKTDTKIKIQKYDSSNALYDGILKITYFSFIDGNDHDNDRVETTWQFDKNMYNGYRITDLHFVYGSDIDTFLSIPANDKYNLSSHSSDFNDDVIVVFMTINNDKYGEYSAYRFVKLYNK